MRVAAAFIALAVTAALLWGIPALVFGEEHAILRLVLDAEIRHPWLRLALQLAWLPFLAAALWVRVRRRRKLVE